ncbi:MAG: DUF3502 domain-containing protein [Lachnospiraceae bacterium]|nr:DUF3502 domain-containing protein [Lachnospiraceae bacterium]
MKNMKKRNTIVSCLLCGAMALSVLGGCGGSAKAAGTSDAAGSKSETSSASDTKSGLDPVTLHFIFFGDKKSATDEVWQQIADYTRDTLNCDYDVQFIAGDDYKQKLLVKAATGDAWDMNFDGDWQGYYQMIAKDAYMNLDDLLPEYAPDLYKKYQEIGVLDAAKSKGHVVALPWTMTMNNRPLLQWRGDLAEKANITVDKDSLSSWEGIDAFLQQLHAAYPDKYTIECTQVIGSEEGLCEIEPGLYFNLNDPECKVIPAEETKSYEEAAKYAEKWQSEGLIWKDVLTDKLDHNSLINEGKLITKWGTHEFANSTRAWVEEGARWDSTELYKDGLFANRTPLANTMCISATSENPERTLMFLNMMETDKTLYDMVQYGIEGKTYNLNGEEAAYPDGMDAASSNFMNWGGQWALWKPQFMRPDSTYKEGFWEEEANYAASSEANVKSPLDGFSFDDTNVQTEHMQRTQIWGDAKKLIEVGLAGDYKAALEKVKADSAAAGMDKLLAEYQKQVDAYLAAKK